ncbi:MAG: DUF3800 domain-containing protein [Candidatus Micrarchaeia archaeon]
MKDFVVFCDESEHSGILVLGVLFINRKVFPSFKETLLRHKTSFKFDGEVHFKRLAGKVRKDDKFDARRPNKMFEVSRNWILELEGKLRNREILAICYTINFRDPQYNGRYFNNDYERYNRHLCTAIGKIRFFFKTNETYKLEIYVDERTQPKNSRNTKTDILSYVPSHLPQKIALEKMSISLLDSKDPQLGLFIQLIDLLSGSRLSCFTKPQNQAKSALASKVKRIKKGLRRPIFRVANVKSKGQKHLEIK